MKAFRASSVAACAVLAVLFRGAAGQELPPPQGFACKNPGYNTRQVLGYWTNPVEYDSITVVRVTEGFPPQVLFTMSGQEQAFSDYPFSTEDMHLMARTRYEIHGSIGGRNSPPVSCASDRGARMPFLRGDINLDGTVSISDVTTLQNIYFKWQTALPWEWSQDPVTHEYITPGFTCYESADFNDDDNLNIVDPIFALEALFAGGPVFPEPFRSIAADSRPASFSCEEYLVLSSPGIDDSFVLDVGKAKGRPGEVVLVPVYATTPVETDAVSLSVTFDPARLSIEAASFDGTVLGRSFPQKGPVTFQGTDSSRGHYRGGFLINLTKDYRIPAASEAHLLDLRVRILDGAPEGPSEIVPQNGIGDPPVSNEFSVLGTAVFAATYPRLVKGAVNIAVPGNVDFFLRGDVDGDGRWQITDPIAALGYLFLGASPLACEKAADADDSGTLQVTDAVLLLGRLFLGEPASLPAPYPGCERDPTPDGLSCDGSSCR